MYKLSRSRIIIILAICLIVDVIYTRQIAKKYEKSGNQRI